MSNPVQNRPLCPAIINVLREPKRNAFHTSRALTLMTENSRLMRECEGRSRQPMLRQNRLRRLRASLTVFVGRLLAIVTPQAREIRSQRMCPFCGLITPRYKTCCLECGKVLEPA
jgi:hypothetical protein